MRQWTLALGLWAMACAGDAGSDKDAAVSDAETDSGGPTELEQTTDAADPTDAAEPTASVDMVISNHSFESQNLEPGGYLFVPYGSPDALISGWTFSASDPYAAYGLARLSAGFDSVEPLASPADGTHAAYLDGREGGADGASSASMTYTLPDTIQPGDTVTVTLAFGVRSDSELVDPHSNVSIVLSTEGGVWLTEAAVTLPAAGSWADGVAVATLPANAAATRVVVSVRVSQIGMPTLYYQTYVDNLRASVVRAAEPAGVAVAVPN